MMLLGVRLTREDLFLFAKALNHYANLMGADEGLSLSPAVITDQAKKGAALLTFLAETSPFAGFDIVPAQFNVGESL